MPGLTHTGTDVTARVEEIAGYHPDVLVPCLGSHKRAGVPSTVSYGQYNRLRLPNSAVSELSSRLILGPYHADGVALSTMWGWTDWLLVECRVEQRPERLTPDPR